MLICKKKIAKCVLNHKVGKSQKKDSQTVKLSEQNQVWGEWKIHLNKKNCREFNVGFMKNAKSTNFKSKRTRFLIKMRKVSKIHSFLFFKFMFLSSSQSSP